MWLSFWKYRFFSHHTADPKLEVQFESTVYSWGALHVKTPPHSSHLLTLSPSLLNFTQWTSWKWSTRRGEDLSRQRIKNEQNDLSSLHQFNFGAKSLSFKAFFLRLLSSEMMKEKSGLSLRDGNVGKIRFTVHLNCEKSHLPTETISCSVQFISLLSCLLIKCSLQFSMLFII